MPLSSRWSEGITHNPSSPPGWCHLAASTAQATAGAPPPKGGGLQVEWQGGPLNFPGPT